jgi:hypothetical protein
MTPDTNCGGVDVAADNGVISGSVTPISRGAITGPITRARLVPAQHVGRAFRSVISRKRCLSSTSICSAERRLRIDLPAFRRDRAASFRLRTCCTTMELARCHDHDLDLVVGRRELGLNGCPRWRIARRHPGIPDSVHLTEMRHVGDPDIG